MRSRWSAAGNSTVTLIGLSSAIGPSFSFGMSASVRFEHEIARDENPDREAWPDSQRRCDVELALASLADTIGGTLTQSAHDVAVLARRPSLCAYAEDLESAAALNSSPQ